MLSRVAGNIYWLGRYLERAENMARIMSVHDKLLMDLPGVDREVAWLPLVAINSTEEKFAEFYDSPSEQNVTRFLIAKPENPSSIVSAVNGVHFNLRSCRAIVPKALYELINELCLLVRPMSNQIIMPSNRRNILREVEHLLLAIAGAISGSMSYNQAFQFIRIGCFLERADMTTRVLDVRSGNLQAGPGSTVLTPLENRKWVAVLKSLQANQMYLAEVKQPVNGPDVLAYVLQNQYHPRAFSFCVSRLWNFLQHLPEHDSCRQQIDQLLQTVDGADIQQLAGTSIELHRYVDDLQIQLAAIGQSISDQYFPAPPG